MRKSRQKKPTLSLSKVLELIGKPTFFLLTIILVTIASLPQLIKYYLRKIRKSFKKLIFPTVKLPKFPTFPRFKKISIPKLVIPKIHVPKLILPNITNINFKIFYFTLILCFFGFLIYWFIFKDLPSVRLLADSPPSLTTKIYDRNGTLLYQIYKDENRSLIKLADLPKHVKDATLAAEDKNFYHHFGVDPVGISRALLNNLRCSIFSVPCSIQGGSTITQQLVKNTLLSPEKTFTRKLKELILALATEYTYSKDQILEMYFNQIGYGGTAYGIEQASWQYFDKSARDLTLAESSMLAGLPIAPTLLSPFGANPHLGKIRQQQVLESMVEIGSITENEKLAALNIPLIFHPQGIEIHAPHFVMYVKDLLVKEYGEDMVSRGGLTVITTLDLSSQNILQTEINTELDKLKNLHVQNGAGLIVAPRTGEILAMVGSRDFFDTERDGQVNITTQQRQPGSSIKPITYALALSRGATPYTTIDDSPICFRIKGQSDYCPKNYDGRFHGTVNLRTALGSSYNIPAIKLLNSYGLPNMIALAKQLGITTWEDSSRFGLSLTLGGGEITMLDLASVYSVFASGGTKIPFTSILSVTDSRGVSLTGNLANGQVGTPKVEGDSPKYVEVLSPAVAYQINSILSDPSARAPAFGFNSILNLPGKNVAVKTGTTNSLRDNWTFGYTTDYLVSTWVGNNDNTPMSSVASGVTGASPIWARTMKKLLENASPSPFTPPPSMVKINISCTESPRYEYFVQGSTLKPNCSPAPSGALLNSAASTSQ